MKIKKIRLWGNKRLMLRDIRFIELDFTSKQQLFIGTNGAGKSTLMRECGPLPAHSSDYLKEGGKVIELEDKDSNYVLTSDFKQSPPHSFIKNGQELNEGGTATVQKDLVKTHFKTYPELWDIVTGDLRFTAMAPLKRRDWILKLSGSDLEYAMSVYKKTTSKHRDSQALVKHYAKRLTEEQGELLDDETLLKHNANIATLNEDLQILYKSRSNQRLSSPQSYRNRIMSLAQELRDHINSAMGIKAVRPTWLKDKVAELRDLERIYTQLDSETLHLDRKLDELYERSRGIKDIIEALQSSAGGDLESLETVTNQAQDEIVEATTKLKKFYNIPNARRAAESFSTIHVDLVDIFSHIEDNSTGRYTQQKAQENRDKLDNLSREMALLDRETNQTYLAIRHLESIDHINCPSCKFSWQPGVDKNNLAQSKLDVVAREVKRADMQKEYDELVEYREKLNHYSTSIRQFNQLVNSNKVLEPLWSHLSELDIHRNPPKKVISVLSLFLHDVEILAKVEDKKQLVANNLLLLTQVKKATDIHGTLTGQQILEIENQIENTLASKSTHRHLMAELNIYIQSLSTKQDMGVTAAEMFKEFDDLYSKFVDTARNEAIEHDIKVRGNEVARLTKEVNDANTAKVLLAEISSHRERADRELQAYKILMEELSPVDGLIANYIKGFVDVFIEQMNAIIAQIWTYDLKILACGLDDTEVTCKFPLSVEGGAVITQDVSKASSSQVDIVDFVFRIVLMYYLGLADYPLFLDELAPTLDEKHRENIMQFVEEFVQGNQCSQMFMISHYATQHRIFENAEICIMDDSNLLQIPERYNDHVKFEPSADLAIAI